MGIPSLVPYLDFEDTDLTDKTRITRIFYTHFGLSYKIRKCLGGFYIEPYKMYSLIQNFT
jgi:hypothetical protein